MLGLQTAAPPTPPSSVSRVPPVTTFKITGGVMMFLDEAVISVAL